MFSSQIWFLLQSPRLRCRHLPLASVTLFSSLSLSSSVYMCSTLNLTECQLKATVMKWHHSHPHTRNWQSINQHNFRHVFSVFSSVQASSSSSHHRIIAWTLDKLAKPDNYPLSHFRKGFYTLSTAWSSPSLPPKPTTQQASSTHFCTSLQRQSNRQIKTIHPSRASSHLISRF